MSTHSELLIIVFPSAFKAAIAILIAILWSLWLSVSAPINLLTPFIIIPSSVSSISAPSFVSSSFTVLILLDSLTLSSSAFLTIVCPSANVAATAITGISSISLGIKSPSITVPLSFEDFISRCACPESGINKRTIEALILSGAFSSFGKYRSQLIDVYPLVMERTIADRKKKVTGQFSIFDTFTEESAVVNVIEYPNIKEYNKETLLKNEKNFAGIYLSGHPLDDYLDKYDSFNFTSDMFEGLGKEEGMESEDGEFANEEMTFDEDQIQDNQQVTCGGQIAEISKKLTKNGNMCFLQVEDIYGIFEAIVFPKFFNKYKDILEEDGLITIRGRTSIRSGNNPVILVESITPWQKKEEETFSSDKKLYLRFDTKNIDVYDKVKHIVATYPGASQMVIKCTSKNSAFAFSSKVDLNNYLINELIGLLGEENVIIK